LSTQNDTLTPQPDQTVASSQTDAVERTPLPPAAQRALQEAQARREAAAAQNSIQPTEIGGRTGPDPVRYGDWESGGIAWDF
jgi:hypothetical protein